MQSQRERQFEGCNFFRLRLAYSLLSGFPIVISNIRVDDENPGLRDHETKLLSLVDCITNGTKVDINRTGTRIHFAPGVLIGGDVSLDCGDSRCISFFLELLVLISPFCKKPLRAKLRGVTNAPGELSVDAIRHTWLSVYSKFVPNDENLNIKVSSRGLLPEGGGSVTFTAPVVKKLRPVQHEKAGKVCKIRGTAWVTKVSPSLAHRLIESAKLALRGYISDVYITVDQRKGAAGGNSPGYGIILTAETTEGVFYHGEAMSKPKGFQGTPSLPEDVGTSAAHALLKQIYLGGCCDSSAQPLAATFMALGEKDVSKFLFGHLNIYSLAALRHIRSFFNVVFKLDEAVSEKPVMREGDDYEESLQLGSASKVLLTGIGVGFSNLNKLVL